MRCTGRGERWPSERGGASSWVLLAAMVVAGAYCSFGWKLVSGIASPQKVAIANCVAGTVVVMLLAFATRLYLLERGGDSGSRHGILEDARNLKQFILEAREIVAEIETELTSHRSRMSPHGTRCLEVARAVLKEATHILSVSEALMESGTPYDRESARVALQKVIVVDHFGTIYLNGEPIPALTALEWRPWMAMLLAEVRGQVQLAA